MRVLKTAQKLAENHKCAVAVLANSPLHRESIKNQVKVFDLPYKRSDPRLALALRKIIKHNNYHIVDTHNPQSHFWGMLATRYKKNTSLISTIHSAESLVAPNVKTMFYDTILRINKYMGAHFITVSKSVNEYLISLSIPQERIDLVSNGLALPEDVKINKTYPLRKQIGWSNEHYLVTIVGRLEPIKGHQFFLKAMPTILKKHPHVRCLIAGTGRDESRLTQLSADLGISKYVHFAGFRNDIDKLLIESDIFCMPSLSEGMPYALLEACLHKVPVLCTQVGGMAELLENGKSGVLVPPENPLALSEGINVLIRDPQCAKFMAEYAFQQVKKNYSLEKTVNETVGVYDKIINNRLKRLNAR